MLLWLLLVQHCGEVGVLLLLESKQGGCVPLQPSIHDVVPLTNC